MWNLVFLLKFELFQQCGIFLLDFELFQQCGIFLLDFELFQQRGIFLLYFELFQQRGIFLLKFELFQQCGIFLLDFVIIPAAWYCLFFIILLYVNVREYRRDNNKNLTTQRNWQHWVGKTISIDK